MCAPPGATPAGGKDGAPREKNECEAKGKWVGEKRRVPKNEGRRESGESDRRGGGNQREWQT